MKKISIISVLFLFVAVIVMAFTLSQTTVPENNMLKQKFHITGCDNCDILYYCMDGNAPVLAGSCEFSVDCGTGNHTICISCSDATDVWRGCTFVCGSNTAIELNWPDLATCNCGDKKKK